MDIVTHAGAVGRGIIGAEHGHAVPLAKGRFHRHLDEVCGAGGALSGAGLRIGAGHVEIAQRAEVQRVRGSHIGQHIFGHQLRHAVGIDRTAGAILGHGRNLGDAVGGRGRAEDEMRHPGGHGSRQQGASLGGVVVVIF